MGPEPASLPTTFSPDSPPEVKERKNPKPQDTSSSRPPEPQKSSQPPPTTVKPESATKACLLPPGTVVRIFGLKSLPALNGQLGQVLRAAESNDRVVVQTKLGEKGLKLENLSSSIRSVCPPGSGLLYSLLSLLTCLVIGHLGYTKSVGGYGETVSLLPFLGATWAFVTLGVGMYLHRPAWSSDTWIPAVYSLGRTPQARSVFRYGFIISGVLFLAANFAYADLIVPHIKHVPLPSLAAVNVSNATIDLTSANEVDADAEALNSSVGNHTVPYHHAVTGGSIVFSGYVAPVALALQGQLKFHGLSVYSLLYVTSAIVFVGSSFQFCTLSTVVFSGPRGADFVQSSELLTLVARFRRGLMDYAPLVVLAVPLGTQLFNRNGMANRRAGQYNFREAIENSGFGTSAAAIQWGALLAYCLFMGTHAVDFWIALKLQTQVL